MESLFQELYNLPKKSIYGLINDAEKKAYIGFSSNTLSSVLGLLSQIKYSNHVLKEHFPKLTFKIFETIEDSNNLRVRYEYWSKEYSNAGYQMYRSFKAVQYKTRIDVLTDFREEGSKQVLFYVKLISNGRKELVVGVFDSVTAAESFIKHNYKSIDNIVYSNNPLTRKYHGR